MTNRRNPSEVVDVFTVLAVLLASRVHTCVKAHVKCALEGVPFIACLLNLSAC